MIAPQRSHELARWRATHILGHWSRMSQQAWLAPFPLMMAKSCFSSVCSQTRSMQCPKPMDNMCSFEPRFLSRQGARRLPVPWPRPHWIHAEHFVSVPPLAQSKRSKPSQRSGGQPRVPKAIPRPIKKTLPPQMPTVPKYLGPIEVRRPTTQAQSSSNKHIPPHAKSTRSAVRCIIWINVIVFFVWIGCASQQICIYEKCKDDQCGHEICREVQWMMMNALNSKFNIAAHRYWTLVTSAFSHIAPRNLLANMLGLAIFARTFYTAGGVGIGAFHIMGLTLGSAIFSNLTGLIYRWNLPLTRHHAKKDGMRAHWTGLGASGVVSTFAAAATCLAPRTRIAVGRFTTPIRLYWVTLLFVASDLIALGAEDGVAHEVHLAGAAFGLAYYLFVLRKPSGWW